MADESTGAVDLCKAMAQRVLVLQVMHHADGAWPRLQSQTTGPLEEFIRALLADHILADEEAVQAISTQVYDELWAEGGEGLVEYFAQEEELGTCCLDQEGLDLYLRDLALPLI